MGERNSRSVGVKPCRNANHPISIVCTEKQNGWSGTCFVPATTPERANVTTGCSPSANVRTPARCAVARRTLPPRNERVRNGPTDRQSGIRKMTTRTNWSHHRYPSPLADLYGEYQPKIASYIQRRISDPALVEDLTAQVFLKALEATKRGKGAQRHFNGWLYRIAHNLVVDHYRAQGWRRDVPLDDTPALCSEPDCTTDAAARSIRRKTLYWAMRRLTHEQATVIRMRLAGYGYEEIAAAMGKTVGAVKALRHRGVQGLRRLLAGLDGEEVR